MKKVLWLFVINLLIISCQKIDDLGVLVPPTVDQDTNLPSVKINVSNNERMVHLRTYGDSANPVLILMHGTYSDTKPYRSIAESLSEKYYVLSYDQRGCGLSERITEDEFTLESAVEEVNQIANLFSPNEKFTLLGHSWGGAISTLFTSGILQSREKGIKKEKLGSRLFDCLF